MGWLFRTIVRQGERASAARGCMLIIGFILLIVLGLVFFLPLLVHALPLVQTTHP